MSSRRSTPPGRCRVLSASTADTQELRDTETAAHRLRDTETKDRDTETAAQRLWDTEAKEQRDT